MTDEVDDMSAASRGSVDGLENRLAKHAENAPYWLLHECEDKWAASPQNTEDQRRPPEDSP
jgi:hypothetical protein